MSKTDSQEQPDDTEEMRPEYDFSKGVRGKYHKEYLAGHSVIIHKTDGTVGELDGAAEVSQMHHIVEVRPLENYRIWVRFADGLEGEVDLSDLVGKGVFAAWDDPAEFRKVFIDPETHTVAWPGGIDLAPDALYQDLVAQRAA